MILPSEDILSVIPQRPPFVMIDSLLYSDTAVTKTTFLVRKENVLVDKSHFTAAGLSENIAQSAAAGAGYSALQNSHPVLNGYIGSIRDLEIFALPKVGDVIETEVVIKDQIFDITIVSGRVTCNDVLLAQCEMKIFTITAEN